MPGSPAEVKTQPRATPPSMPPPPPAASQGATRHPSFTPHTNREDGPAMSLPHGRFHGCLKWSMVCLLMNGSSPSPTAVSGTPSTPSGFSNGPATSCTASLSTQQLPPACGARQLSKLKRFLATLQQFGSDISPEIGERVRTLVLGLVNSTLTIEEFHSKLQEATNFPLRPFVIPFLKANLPLLQRELLHCARLAKQTPAQYLAQHEQLLLDANASSPTDPSELLPEVNENGKRRTPDRTKENGSDRDPLHPDHLSKRPCTLSPAQRCSPSNGLPQPTPPPHYRLEDMAVAHHFRDSYRHLDPRELRERHRQLAVHGSRPEEVIDHRLTEREWSEEWKHLNNLLNCIMDMAEKTRRSLTVLRRCQEADREELNHWIRRYSDAAEDSKKGPAPAARPLGSSVGAEGSQLDVHRESVPRTLSSYMPEEIWRKAEEAVNEVKRQAMSELQKAVSDAERKAHELISMERAKMERALAEARRQASEDALTVVNQQEDSSEELEAIKLKLWAMEQAQRPKPPGEQGPEGEEEDATALLAGQLLSPETGGLRGHSPGAGGLFQPLWGDPAGHHPVRQVLRTPQGLCIHRVCHRELGPGRCGAGQERLPRPGHQGAAQKNQFTRDQLHGPRGPSGTPRRQGGTLPSQQLPGRGPFQTTGAEPVGWALGGRNPIGAGPGGRGSVGPGWVRWAEPWKPLAPRSLSGQGARKVLAVVFTVLKGGPGFESGAAAGSGVDSRAPRGTIYSAQNNYASPFPRREDGPDPTAEATGHEAGHGVGLARGLVGALEGTGQSCGQVRPRQRWVSFGSAYSGLFH
ncbi:protein CBFA2T3 isoform X3 [Balaenoptera acutorostrata]|nr:protein CBFA2T3 isoform X3 [Balaenoptera acutorostrata]XP_057390657.1 protein CBFA2T3 isoform X3 [Balaenoptera acutorostrata]XP_057390658.1 protein CBFA2T3 isoform X3 [Balaenoptera acutorostrata]